MKTCMGGNTHCLGIALALLLSALPATAQQPGPVPSLTREPAWAKNVSLEQQQAAVGPFEQGNTMLKESLFIEAAKKYRESLQHWDHPATSYNLALAMMNLDKPDEVYALMNVSIAHGQAPLGPDRYQHAQKYIERMEHDYARMTLLCRTDTSVTLKSEIQHLPVSCQRFERLLRPGPYLLSATHDGYQLPDLKLDVEPGQKLGYRLEIEEQRRWAAWKPWAVMGAGAALAVGGRLIHMKARDDLRAFDARVDELGGWMPPDPQVVDARPRAKTLQRVAAVSYAVGGAAVFTGVALLYVNRLQPKLHPVPLGDNELTVTPVVGGGQTGVQASTQF
ncbi:hypothetical protein [Hyalangium minutum]|uniref:Tetratricopeptide repeat protein n=1 Tax=Hyalangium minutum TaxID=394096 RepID=A0A085WKM5_9BACT|nr:hypothetical protein [Hyalangium minutum]KFE68238.1 hypothetical protein DB31_7475 [Hyalangium minutum]